MHTHTIQTHIILSVLVNQQPISGLAVMERQLWINMKSPVFRVYPFLCRAVRNFARDHGNVPLNKEFYVALEDLPTRHK